MSINDIFVGQHVFKQAHTHAKLYRTCATVKHLFRPLFCALCSPDQTEGSPRLAINSSSILHPPSVMSLHAVTQKYVNN